MMTITGEEVHRTSQEHHRMRTVKDKYICVPILSTIRPLSRGGFASGVLEYMSNQSCLGIRHYAVYIALFINRSVISLWTVLCVTEWCLHQIHNLPPTSKNIGRSGKGQQYYGDLYSGIRRLDPRIRPVWQELLVRFITNECHLYTGILTGPDGGSLVIVTRWCVSPPIWICDNTRSYWDLPAYLVTDHCVDICLIYS